MEKEIVVRKMKRLISVIMLLTMLAMLTSCEHWMTKKAYKTDEFLFYNNTIIELRKKALEQESLVIPKYLNGQEVYGIRDIREYAVAGEKVISINGDRVNLKNIYFNEFMGNLHYADYNSFRIYNMKNIFIISNDMNLSKGTTVFLDFDFMAGSQNYYISNFLLYKLVNLLDEDNNQYCMYNKDKKSLKITDSGNNIKQYIYTANLSFMYNYEGSPNYDYCFIDNTENGKVNRPKYDPIREGYKFTGWYKDSECKEKFNFEEKIEIDIENYKENKIYAGWEKIV